MLGTTPRMIPFNVKVVLTIAAADDLAGRRITGRSIAMPDLSRLLSQADEALYGAKGKGRNRVQTVSAAERHSLSG